MEFADDEQIRAIAASGSRMLIATDLERALTVRRTPRVTQTLGPWIEGEIGAAHPNLSLTAAYTALVADEDEPNVAARVAHLRRILRGVAIPHPSTIWRLGERLRAAPKLRIESSSGLSASLAAGRYYDTFGASAILFHQTGYAWPGFQRFQQGPLSREAFTVPTDLRSQLSDAWQSWHARRRRRSALRPLFDFLLHCEGIRPEVFLRLVESEQRRDSVRCPR